MLTWALAAMLLGVPGGVAVAGSGERTEQQPLHERRCFGAAWRDPTRRCFDRTLTRAVWPTPTAALLTPFAPCIPLGRPGILAPCRFGMQRRWARDEIALVGDSHAGHWRAPVRILARARRWRGTSLTRPGCPLTAARVLVTRPTLASCRQWYREVIRWFERHPEVHIVFVSGHAHFPVAVAPGRSGFAARVAGYVAAWRALPRTVRHILVIRDVPRRRLRTLDCVERQMAARGRAGVACAAPRSRVLRPDPAAVAVSRLSHSRVHIIDLTRFFCSRRLCFPVVGGALVHKDVGHMTTAFAESLAPYMARRVNTLLPPPPGRRGRPARQLASGIRDPSASR